VPVQGLASTKTIRPWRLQARTQRPPMKVRILERHLELSFFPNPFEPVRLEQPFHVA